MTICYRDSVGTIARSLDPDYGIAFDGAFAYCTDTAGRDYKIPVSDIVSIQEV